MKFQALTLKAILPALLAFAVIAPAKADENEPGHISKSIGSQLSLPASLIRPDFNTELKVDFRINADGSLEVIRVINAGPELKEHVIKQFGKLRLNDVNIDTARVYRLPVKYKVV
jgi:hypothetical protein